MTTVDSDCLGEIHWCGDGAYNFTCSLFLNRYHDGVIYNLFMLFTNWGHNRVVDNSLTSLMYRLANGVVDYLFVCFTNRNHNRIVDNLLVCLMHRLHDCVVDNLFVLFAYRYHYRVLNVFGVGVVHWSTNVVRYLSSLSVVNWLRDGIFTSPSFVNWLTNRLIDGSVACFALRASHIDYLVFGNRLVLGACALLYLLFINYFTNSLHYCVSCRRTSASFTSATILVAYSSTIVGVGSTGQSSQQGYQDRYHEQPSHLPFSLKQAYVTG